MILLHPRQFADIHVWAAEYGLNLADARERFAQFAILSAISDSETLRSTIVFKGGNALDFVWSPNRSTKDLDFSLDPQAGGFELGIDGLRDALVPPLGRVGARLQMAFQINGIRRNPPGAEKTFVTYQARIGYALPDQDGLKRRLGEGRPSPQIVPVEVSINEPICGSTDIVLGTSEQKLRVSTVEDIVAEKLRALLQQPVRNRSRQQDLLDIALIVRERASLDRGKVANFVQRKSASRDVDVSKAAFHNPEVANRARRGYNDLASTTRRVFIPFEEALALLLAFVNGLDIPE